MSSRQAFRTKHNQSYKESRLFFKNIESANDLDCDFDCPELTRISNVMVLAEKLQEEGWKVKVAPYEDVPILHIRSKRKEKTK